MDETFKQTQFEVFPEKPPKPTLFLDIDGVLHSDDDVSWGQNGKVEGNTFRWSQRFYDLMAEFPNVQVVLHSTWRCLWDTEAEVRANLPAQLSAIIVAMTDPRIGRRWWSIVDYIETHGITKYVIVDDMVNEFPYRLPQLVGCKPDKGISDQVTYEKLRAKLKEING